jgi:hypothetical protein
LPRETVRLLHGVRFGFRQKKPGLELLQASSLVLTPTRALLIAVIITIVAMVTMLPVVRRPVVIGCSVIRIPTVIVIATGIIPVISRIAVIAVPVRRVTESESDSSDAD